MVVPENGSTYAKTADALTGFPQQPPPPPLPGGDHSSPADPSPPAAASVDKKQRIFRQGGVENQRPIPEALLTAVQKRRTDIKEEEQSDREEDSDSETWEEQTDASRASPKR